MGFPNRLEMIRRFEPPESSSRSRPPARRRTLAIVPLCCTAMQAVCQRVAFYLEQVVNKITGSCLPASVSKTDSRDCRTQVQAPLLRADEPSMCGLEVLEAEPWSQARWGLGRAGRPPFAGGECLQIAPRDACERPCQRLPKRGTRHLQGWRGCDRPRRRLSRRLDGRVRA